MWNKNRFYHCTLCCIIICTCFFMLGDATYRRPSTSNEHQQSMDPRERRRQRDRDRYARMSVQQKEELLKKRRGSYQQKKTEMTNITIKNQLQGNIDK